MLHNLRRNTIDLPCGILVLKILWLYKQIVVCAVLNTYKHYRGTIVVLKFMSNIFRKIIFQLTISDSICTKLGMAQQLANWF